jgi:hypothetical protein
MDKRLIIPLVGLSLLGLFLLGSGITGMVISESCCLGTACRAETMCDFAKPNLESPAGGASPDAFLGLGLILLSVGLFAVLNRSP